MASTFNNRVFRMVFPYEFGAGVDTLTASSITVRAENTSDPRTQFAPELKERTHDTP